MELNGNRYQFKHIVRIKAKQFLPCVCAFNLAFKIPRIQQQKQKANLVVFILNTRKHKDMLTVFNKLMGFFYF